MPDISEEIQSFREAVYGEEVRGSIISLAEKLNAVHEEMEETEAARITAENQRAEAEAEREAAEAERQEALSAMQSATEAAAGAAGAAEEAAEAAGSAAETAASAASEAQSAAAAASEAGEYAREQGDGAKEAAGEAEGIAETLQQKLENGEFQGAPGVSTSLGPGLFMMYVNDAGNLILCQNDNEPEIPLSIQDGNLVYTIS